MGPVFSIMRSYVLPVVAATKVMGVEFYVLLDNELALVSASLDDNLVELFERLREHPITSSRISKKATPNNSMFYRLRNPVLISQSILQKGNEVLHQAKRKCEEMGNRLQVEPSTTTVRLLAPSFSRELAYLVIELPDSSLEPIDSTKELRENHSTLFRCLQVKVGCLGVWTPTDVVENLKGGIITKDITALPTAFGEIQDTLSQPRQYDIGKLKDTRDFQIARESCKRHFERVFIPVEDTSSTSVRCREFAAFYNVLRGFDDDVLRIASQTVSSSLKASNFAVHFLQPPFFSLLSCDFEYEQDKSWSFPIFVDAMHLPNVFRKFIPKSDCMVFSSLFDVPFIICEVVSDPREIDRHRMLIEATALARVGQYLLQPTSSKKFFVVAIYVDENMVASRYIVMQTEGDHSESNHGPVFIHERSFNLRENDKQIDFLQEMYNLAAQVAGLSGDLDQVKESELRDIYVAANNMKSLSNKSHAKAMDNHSIVDGCTESWGFQDDDLGFFDSEGIQSVLRQMNYKIEFIPYGHPHLAVIVNKSEERGYLKFVDHETEVDILQYLAGIQSTSNHTISDVRFWPVERGTVISMPVAGGWLTKLKNRNEQLLSVALQLVEAVVFMHEHNVAHLDLKPSNLIIPRDGGRLSIIDFSASIRVHTPDAKYTGVVGTEGYMAPEILEGSYKPMLADLWSCGRTLEEFCSGCHASVECITLLQISRELTNRDPEARPKMPAVLEQLTSLIRQEGNAVSHLS